MFAHRRTGHAVAGLLASIGALAGCASTTDRATPPATAVTPATSPAPTTSPTVAAAATRPADPPAFEPALAPAGKPDFVDLGAKSGERLPLVPLLQLPKPDAKPDEWDGKPRPTALADVGRYRPTLILTSSFTCPKSRSTYPAAAALAERYDNKIEVAIVYVVEAHPQVDPSPYGGVEDVTAENQRDRILFRQPRSFDERVALATRFRDRVGGAIPIHVDAMDDAGWRALGGGPNMGVLVDEHGVVLYRQGWFDAKKMSAAIDAMLARRAAADAGRRAGDGPAPALPPGVSEYSYDAPFRDGDVEAARKLLDAAPHLVRRLRTIGRGPETETLLHAAAAYKRAAVAELLLDRGADVNADSPHMSSPLHAAAQAGDPAVVRLLLARGGDPNRPADPANKLSPTPLHEALIHGRREAAKLLLDAGARADAFTEAATGDVEALRRRSAADPSILRRPDGAGRTLLGYAAANARHDVIRFLAAAGAVDEPAAGGVSSALHWTYEADDLATAKLLLESKASRGSVADQRYPLVDGAASDGKSAWVELLLAHGADVTAQSWRGWQPIHHAAARDRADVVDLLLRHKASASAVTGPEVSGCGPPDGYLYCDQPLHLAAQWASAKSAAMLLDRGADVNARDHYANTPLHRAVDGYGDEGKRLEIVRLLLDRGADVNAKDEHGKTVADQLASPYNPKPDDAAVAALVAARGGKRGADVEGPPGKRCKEADEREGERRRHPFSISG